MAIKQIQLRGISRTPSDRLTNDGGCAESLNVQLDNTELAPSFYPDDVTTKRGLPADLEAKKIFIHKTANYENYIVVQSDRVVAYTPDIEDEEPLKVLDLAEGEEVNDITSVGNTIIIAATKKLYYALFRDNAYVFLGNEVPFPTIEFFDSRTTIAPAPDTLPYDSDSPHGASSTQYVNEKVSLIEEDGAIVVAALKEHSGVNESVTAARVYFDEEFWNEVDEQGNNTNAIVSQLAIPAIKNLYDKMKEENRGKGVFINPVWACYAVRLYDGSLIVSTPQLLSPGKEVPVEIYGLSDGIPYDDDIYSRPSKGIIFVRLNHAYKIGLRMWNDNGALSLQWKDIVKGVDVFISEDINRLDFSGITIAQRSTFKDVIQGVVPVAFQYVQFKIKGEENSFIRNALDMSVFCYVESFYIDENYYPDGVKSIKELKKDFILDSRAYIKNEDRLQKKKLSDFTHDVRRLSYKTNSLTVYNNQVLLIGADTKYSNSPSCLTSQRYNVYVPIPFLYVDPGFGDITSWLPSWWKQELRVSTEDEYSLSFEIRDNVTDISVRGNNPYRLVKRYDDLQPSAYSLIIYPSSSVKRVRIKGASGSKDRDMSSHATLPNLSYYYEDKPLDYDLNQQKDIHQGTGAQEKGNYIHVMKQDNPLFVEKNIAFQSKVLGVAVATTALSQGQFGQFPLYVFTEDGIWAMETGADGSFVSQKPLSREVCINPDSITSLDNAVVFVTAQGVMLLQGSQATNISPFMNGRHYDVEESAKNIINGQKDFKDFVPIIDDETHFFAFMREAKIAYDYAGKRLVFIKEGEQYQYIYKLDTQTWHKSAYGMNLVAPINSYPECLVMGEGEWVEKEYLKIISFEKAQLDEYDLSDDFISMFGDHYELTKEQLIEVFTAGSYLDITQWTAAHTTQMEGYLKNERVEYEIVANSYKSTKVLDLSTILDASESKTPTKGVIATRPLNLGESDVFKTITDVRIRGQYSKGAVKFILLGSNDGVTFYTINTLRGKAWKLFRIIILADLQPTDRISWIDVQYETRFANRLR